MGSCCCTQKEQISNISHQEDQQVEFDIKEEKNKLTRSMSDSATSTFP